ncbi:MAG TPA: hypothetical protein VIV40_24795 [Kofleriaceae bacterium]
MNRLLIALPVLGLSTACINLARRDEAAEARRAEQMCGDPNFAYESGYNDGLARKQLDTSWTMRCMPEYAQQARTSYQTGYAGGIEHAPIVVRGMGGGGRAAYSSGETCRFSSDCGEGRSCRADASGTNVCMGDGYAGDACWFSSDCVSGSCDSGAKTCR